MPRVQNVQERMDQSAMFVFLELDTRNETRIAAGTTESDT